MALWKTAYRKKLAYVSIQKKSGLTYPPGKGGRSPVISEGRETRTTHHEPVPFQRPRTHCLLGGHPGDGCMRGPRQIGQVQNFDANSRWVPMLSRAGHLTTRAPRSRQASPEDRQTEPDETPRLQFAQARAFVVTKRGPAVIDVAIPTPPHDAVTSVARSAPGEALSV